MEEHHPSRRQSTVRILYGAARTLRHFPKRGRPGSVEGTRELVVLPLPCIVVYGVRPDLVHIFRIIHTSKYWPEVL